MAMIHTQQTFYCHFGYNRLVFDAIGFLFVLLLIRILGSYSFFYVRLELQTQAELSQLGASLLSQLNWLELVEYRQRTTTELESIKAKVKKLRQRRVSIKLTFEYVYTTDNVRSLKNVMRILTNQSIIMVQYFLGIITCSIRHLT